MLSSRIQVQNSPCHEKIIMPLPLVLLALSLFCSALAIAQPATASADNLAERLQEAQEMRAAFEEENRQLRTMLAEKDSEIDKLRSRYADLIINTQLLISRLQELELRSAHLLNGGKPAPSASDLNGSAEALAATKRKLLELENLAGQLENQLNTALDILNPSSVMRDSLLKQLVSLKKTVQDSLLLLAGQHDNQRTPNCTILSIDQETRIAILDKGYLAGLRPGSTLSLFREDTVVTTVKIIESKAEASAAVLESGTWEALLPGLTLK